MIQVVLSEGNPPIPLWMDLTDPTSEEIYGVAENYQLHPRLIQDCLDPSHLPKYEQLEDTTFIIVRHYDDHCDLKKTTVQSMTRKLAFFLGDRFLISVHRQEQPFIEKFKEKYRTRQGPVFLQVIMLEMLMAAVQTYHKPLEEMENSIQNFETDLIRNRKTMTNWGEIFRTKCRLSVINRLLWHTKDSVQKLAPFSDANKTIAQDVIERIESLRFFADSLLEDLNALLNIQLALAGHRANEESHKANMVMKILTIFSAFFLPLNFIVGIYGMNFENMPELKHPYGYFGVWIALLSTVAIIYTWFVRKGWIRWGHLS